MSPIEQKICEMMENNGFSAPYLGENFETATPKVIAFFEWVELELEGLKK